MKDEEPGEASSRRARRTQPRILLVQPDPVLGLALTRFLSDYFARIALAASDSALTALLREGAGYDVIIVDDGAGRAALDACLEAGRAHHFARPHRVILLSGRHPHGAPTAVRHVLEKPVPGSLLLASVDACLGPGLHKSRPREGGKTRHQHR